MTEARAAWIAAFHKAHHDLPTIGKDTTVKIETSGGGSYTYKYAPLPEIIEKVAGILKGNGFSIAQDVTGDGATVGVSTRIYHKEGWVETFGPLALKVTGDAKAAGSAITYARRYALCAALGIAPDEDDDGAEASKPEPVEQTPWKWLVGEWGIFKHWTEDQRLAAAKQAFDTYAYTSATLTRIEAENVLEFMRNAYETEAAEQETLNV
jgi:hypothetical protein